VKLNVEAFTSIAGAGLTGSARLGVPDDYADRYLPEIMARFARSHPGVELTIVCEPTVSLLDRIDNGDIDLAIITHSSSNRHCDIIRRERLLWVTSTRSAIHLEEVVPLALGRQTCAWRRIAIEKLQGAGRLHRILYTSWNAGAIGAAVLAGLAVSVFPESALRPGMRVIGEQDGFPALPAIDIGLLRNAHEPSALADALAAHIVQGLDNLSEAAAAE
jgi:DNA-binding transcriptional LysR family regulator